MLRRNLVKNLLGLIGLGAIPATVLAKDDSNINVFESGKIKYHTENNKVFLIEHENRKEYYKEGKLHRDGDLPAVEWIDGTKEWYKEGKIHRDGDLPAKISSNGTKVWFKNGLRHRDNDLPAIEDGRGKEWFKNGLRHRDNDLPAIIYSKLLPSITYPLKFWVNINMWYKEGELHRDNDLPAIEYENGHKEYWVKGLRHRDGDLPAIEYSNGYKEYYKKGLPLFVI